MSVSKIGVQFSMNIKSRPSKILNTVLARKKKCWTQRAVLFSWAYSKLKRFFQIIFIQNFHEF